MKTKILSCFYDVIIWGILLALYIPVFKQLYLQRWASIDYTHAYLILPVSLFLAWRKRTDIGAALSYSGSVAAGLWGAGLIFSGLLLFLFGWRMGMLMLPSMALVPLLFGVVLYRYNTQVARFLVFPILYLLLMVPPPLGILDAVTLPMRYAVSFMTEGILQVFLPVQRDGLMLSVERTQVYVGAPCSGFRSLISVFALALVYAHLLTMSFWRKLVLVLLMVPLALAGNLLRVISLTLVTYWFGREAGEGFFHGFSGMVIFGLIMLVLLQWGKVLSGDEHD